MQAFQIRGIRIEQGLAVHREGDAGTAGGADLGEGHTVGGAEGGQAALALGAHAHDDAS